MPKKLSKIKSWIIFQDRELFCWLNALIAIGPWKILFFVVFEGAERVFGEGVWENVATEVGLGIAILLFLIAFGGTVQTMRLLVNRYVGVDPLGDKGSTQEEKNVVK